MSIKENKPYKIAVSNNFRYMIANRNIKAGELILRETPIVVGPRRTTGLLCLGCFKKLSLNEYKLCENCNVAPFCISECSTEFFHDKYECEYYQKLFKKQPNNNFIVSNLQLVLPLKCLMLKLKSDKEKIWEKFTELKSCIKIKPNGPWKHNEESIEKVLISIGALKKQDIWILQKICEILDEYSFEIRGPTNKKLEQSEQLRGVYYKARFISHDCIGNTLISVADNYEMTIRASSLIKTGEAILFNYANPLEGTFERLQILRYKNIHCTCKRCSDPTELNTYMGSIKCPICLQGNVIYSTSNKKEWYCEMCKNEFYEGLIKTTISEGKSITEKIEILNLDSLENLLKKMELSFPPTSSVIIKLKQQLLNHLYKKIMVDPQIKKEVLKKIIALCQELLNLFARVEPGISRLRGLTLYKLYQPMLILATMEYEGKELTLHKFLNQLSISEKTLKEAISILIYETPNSPEGRLMKIGLEDLRRLREKILKLTISNENNVKTRK